MPMQLFLNYKINSLLPKYLHGKPLKQLSKEEMELANLHEAELKAIKLDSSNIYAEYEASAQSQIATRSEVTPCLKRLKQKLMRKA